MPVSPFPGLAPAIPEIVLVCSAMALLILGVLRGEGSTRLVSWLSVWCWSQLWRSPAGSAARARSAFNGMFVTTRSPSS